MEVLSSVAIALDDSGHVNLGELGLEVLEAEHGVRHPLPRHGEGVLPWVNVGHGAVVANKVLAYRGLPEVSQRSQLPLRIVWVPVSRYLYFLVKNWLLNFKPCISQQVRVLVRIIVVC